jgi:tetratricopeptide (TPR) repeat protein
VAESPATSHRLRLKASAAQGYPDESSAAGRGDPRARGREAAPEAESADVFAALGEGYSKVAPGDDGPSSKPKGLVYVGIAHRLRDELDEAREAFARALELAPDHAEAHESLGAMELIGGRPAEAIPHLERATDQHGSKAINRSNGGLPGYSLHSELELMVEAGHSPLEAMRSATLAPARYFESTDSMGVIAPGAVADLVLLDRNPLEEITNTRGIHAVVLKVGC